MRCPKAHIISILLMGRLFASELSFHRIMVGPPIAPLSRLKASRFVFGPTSNSMVVIISAAPQAWVHLLQYTLLKYFTHPSRAVSADDAPLLTLHFAEGSMVKRGKHI